MLQELLKTNTKYFFKKYNNDNLKKLLDFDKDTEFILSQITPESSFIIPEKEQKKNEKNKSIPKKIEHNNHNHNHDHTKCSSCIQCHPYHRQLKKQKNNLVDFINKNKIKNIKLIGNYRYNNSSPEKYVHDNERHIPIRRMGLIPLPLKKKEKKYK